MEKRCDNCGNKFEVTKNNENQKFCNRKCYRLNFKKKKEYVQFQSLIAKKSNKSYDKYFYGK